MLTIAAMVTAPNCFSHLPSGAEAEALTCWKTFLHPEGDHFTLVNLYKAFQDVTLNSTSEHCVEKWCHDYFLNCSALRMADVIRAELLEIIKRIELPYAEPAFGSKENTLNIKKALLSGYFMQIARDVDGSGNYLMLTHKQVAQLHPCLVTLSPRRCRSGCSSINSASPKTTTSGSPQKSLQNYLCNWYHNTISAICLLARARIFFSR